MPLRWRDLTEDERAGISNGCGGKGGCLDAPDFLFEASCDHHDFNYWLGHREVDRERADRQFYAAMKRDVARDGWWWRRWALRAAARTYYAAVRLFGSSFFHYGPRERDRSDLAISLEIRRAIQEATR